MRYRTALAVVSKPGSHEGGRGYLAHNLRNLRQARCDQSTYTRRRSLAVQEVWLAILAPEYIYKCIFRICRYGQEPVPPKNSPLSTAASSIPSLKSTPIKVSVSSIRTPLKFAGDGQREPRPPGAGARGGKRNGTKTARQATH